MKPQGGRPRKRGTQKVHTSQRIEVADKQWLDAQASALGISTPDLIHSVVQASRIIGTDAHRVVVLSAQVVQLENVQETLRRIAGSFRSKASDAHEKNYQLAQKLRAYIAAVQALPPAIRDSLPDRLLAVGKRVLAENTVPDDQRVVAL
jgi:hypothetical protein